MSYDICPTATVKLNPLDLQLRVTAATQTHDSQPGFRTGKAVRL